MRTFDAFLFYNELEILDWRLKILDPYVDYFIISECDYTFSGDKKEFNFEINKKKFTNYAHKIIYIKNYNSNKLDINFFINNETNDTRKNIYKFINNEFIAKKNNWKEAPHYSRDFLHREYVRFGFEQCQENDLIIFGDLDEIPSSDAIEKTKLMSDNKIFCCQQDMYYYSLNIKAIDLWYGTRITRFKNLEKMSLNSIRNETTNQVIIKNGGWHFSFFGGIDRVKDKIKYYSHQEYNNKIVLSNIERNLSHGRDIFNRNIKFNWVQIGESHPELIQNNILEFNNFLTKKPKINLYYKIKYLFIDKIRLIKYFLKKSVRLK